MFQSAKGNGLIVRVYQKNGAPTITSENHTGTIIILTSGVNSHYTVILDINVGDAAASQYTLGTYSVAVAEGSAMPTPIILPTLSGKTFQGYFDARVGGNQYYNADGTSARNWDRAESATLYAHWG
jgi:hypothetical protein